MPGGQVALFVIGTVLIIFAAYYATSYIGKLGMRMTGKKSGRQIVLRERFALSKDKSFCIVEICGKTYIVGITNQSMTVLDTLDGAAVTADDAAQSGAKPVGLGAGFAAVLAARGWPKKTRQAAPPEEKSAAAPTEEEGGE